MTTIYEQIGGNEAVAAVVDSFYERVMDDGLLAPYFEYTEMRKQKAHMRAFLASALGGALIFAGRDMKAAHAGLGVTHEAFDQVLKHLMATLVELDVPTNLIVAIGGKVAPLRAMVVAERAAA